MADADDRRKDGVPAEDMDFEVGDDTVTTKVGTVGWPDAAENDPNIGPSGEELGADGNPVGGTTPEPEPEPETPQNQPSQTASLGSTTSTPASSGA